MQEVKRVRLIYILQRYPLLEHQRKCVWPIFRDRCTARLKKKLKKENVLHRFGRDDSVDRHVGKEHNKLIPRYLDINLKSASVCASKAYSYCSWLCRPCIKLNWCHCMSSIRLLSWTFPDSVIISYFVFLLFKIKQITELRMYTNGIYLSHLIVCLSFHKNILILIYCNVLNML